MEQRSKDMGMILYSTGIGYLIDRVRGKEIECFTLKTTIVARKLWNSVYGCSLACYETSCNKFIWWKLELKEEMLEILNASYITGNPVIIKYVNLKEEIEELEKRIYQIETDKVKDILPITIEIVKYK